MGTLRGNDGLSSVSNATSLESTFASSGQLYSGYLGSSSNEGELK